MATLTEADVEAAALEWLADLGWQKTHGPDIAPGTPGAERDDYRQPFLERRLRDALDQLNPDLPSSAVEDALRKLTQPEEATLEARNRAFHRLLVDGVTVEYRAGDGAIRGEQARVIDFKDPTANNWLAVNQFTITENQNTRRPDIVLFVNGLPLGVIELKNPTDAEATIWTAWQQLQTYQSELPTLFSMNEALIVSDGLGARIGALGAGTEWFKPWRTISGENLTDLHLTELQIVLEGVCEPDRFLALLHDFIVFDDDGSGRLVKKMAGYHQFHAVRVALDETLRAAGLLQSDQQIDQLVNHDQAGRHPGGEARDRRIGSVHRAPPTRAWDVEPPARLGGPGNRSDDLVRQGRHFGGVGVQLLRGSGDGRRRRVDHQRCPVLFPYGESMRRPRRSDGAGGTVP